MRKIGLFIAGLLLGLFVGRFYHLMRVVDPMATDPAITHKAANTSEAFVPCEEVVSKR